VRAIGSQFVVGQFVEPAENELLHTSFKLRCALCLDFCRGVEWLDNFTIISKEELHALRAVCKAANKLSTTMMKRDTVSVRERFQVSDLEMELAALDVLAIECKKRRQASPK
jgi:hypothetical protein